MGLLRFVPIPVCPFIWTLTFFCLAPTPGCDRKRAVTCPSTSPGGTQASQAASEETSIKLAALRHLISEQPRAADRHTYAAYLISDDAAEELAGLLSGVAWDGPSPPIVASLDVYTRKGRTMDRKTGRPVKVFRARLAGPPSSDGAAEVIASWRVNRLAAAEYRYRLRKQPGGWEVVGRAEETP